MLRIMVLLALSTLFSGYSYATCYGNSLLYAPPIHVDLSDKLSARTPVWEGSFVTQYSGAFRCTTSNSTFGYTPILSTDSSKATILGFNNGQYWIRAEITNEVPGRTISGMDTHFASELNVTINVRFSLVNRTGRLVAGDTANLQDVIFVTDLSGMSALESFLWPGRQLLKILQWLVNGFNWPYDQRDMYGQPMIIKYSPKMTTCSFDNAGLMVKLPTLGLSQVARSTQSGRTPFTLNFSCQNLQNDGSAGRDISMFLSSNNLLATDNSVLVDNSAGAAKGIGIRLAKVTSPGSPVLMSRSNTERGTATSLFNVARQGRLNERFSIGMVAYYYPYNLNRMTSGAINTSATLNIIYQ